MITKKTLIGLRELAQYFLDSHSASVRKFENEILEDVEDDRSGISLEYKFEDESNLDQDEGPGTLKDQSTKSRYRTAKFNIGQIVRHRVHPFRGVIFDVDPVFTNTEEWWESIPENVRPVKEQPYYHLLAENNTTTYIAYVSEQNLMADEDLTPVNHPDIEKYFDRIEDSNTYMLKH